MPNLKPEISLVESHVLSLPSLCPVSSNPKEGSTITITYTPTTLFLEVYSLEKFINSFKNGREVNGVFVRDMEQTIQVIKQECERATGTNVTVEANLILDAGRMILKG